MEQGQSACASHDRAAPRTPPIIRVPVAGVKYVAKGRGRILRCALFKRSRQPDAHQRAAQLNAPNQPRRAIHFANSSTGEMLKATPMTIIQSTSGRLKVPNGSCRKGR